MGQRGLAVCRLCAMKEGLLSAESDITIGRMCSTQTTGRKACNDLGRVEKRVAELRRGSGPLLPPSASTVLTGGEISATDGAEEKTDDGRMKLCNTNCCHLCSYFFRHLHANCSHLCSNL